MSISINDQCQRTVDLEAIPKRIISLVPSQTELLYDLGLENHIVGITRFCVHPQQALEHKIVVGGTKKIVEKRVRDLKPDLIICNKEENTPQIVDFCSSICPTYVSDVATLSDALEMIDHLSKLTGSTTIAQKLSSDIAVEFKKLANLPSKLRALYLIWKKPYMSVGRDTFINEMMSHAGFRNVLDDQVRYPQLELNDIINLKPDVILLSSEPYSFTTSDADDINFAFAKANQPQKRIIIVDGEPFSWYGSRLLQSPAYFRKLREQLQMS